MDEFGGASQLGVVGDLFLHPVFDGLDVVVGDALDILDAGGVGLGEAFHQLTQALARGLGEGGQLGQAGVGQGHQAASTSTRWAMKPASDSRPRVAPDA